VDKYLDKAIELLNDGCIITGGHFRIFFKDDIHGEHLNEGTIKSFRLAALLYSHAKENKFSAGLGLLINDMGSACDENGCEPGKVSFSRADYRLPEVYLKIMEEQKIPLSSIKIYWEKHIRNQSKKELLKRFKKTPDIFIFENTGLFISDNEKYGKIILTRTSGKDKYGVPACPLIMSGLNLEQAKTYKRSINFYYTGDDNIENIPNYFVIEKGKRVSELFSSEIEVNNIYFS
jgi:hypothetical protein